MTTELTPLGVACNLACSYCYQHPMRDAGNANNKGYDMQKMFAALEREGSDFLVFGGEPLLVPLDDLITIFDWGFTRFKKNGIQTNGVLITPEHIAAFKKYNVHVGFSMDGPDELNDSRWNGTEEKTRASTVRSHANLQACIDAGVATSLIITLYKGNAMPDRLPRLKAWIRHLDTIGVRGVRIHLLEVDHALVKARMQLTEDRTIEVLLELVQFEATLPRLRFDILDDMRKLLRTDDDSVTCIWNPCDPYTTSAVRGVDGQGNQSNCGRTNKDGIARVKASQHGFERQLSLYYTPQEQGGCQGCRFFLMCKGQCPGTAIDGDWRNRSSDCRVWMRLFEGLEAEMEARGELPMSRNDRERPILETVMLDVWGRGEHISMKSALAQIRAGVRTVQGYSRGSGHGDLPHGDSHGDHTDTALVQLARAVPVPVEAPHGDSPHGDSHGDHNDAEATQ